MRRNSPEPGVKSEECGLLAGQSHESAIATTVLHDKSLSKSMAYSNIPVLIPASQQVIEVPVDLDEWLCFRLAHLASVCSKCVISGAQNEESVATGKRSSHGR